MVSNGGPFRAADYSNVFDGQNSKEQVFIGLYECDRSAKCLIEQPTTKKAAAGIHDISVSIWVDERRHMLVVAPEGTSTNATIRNGRNESKEKKIESREKTITDYRPNFCCSSWQGSEDQDGTQMCE